MIGQTISHYPATKQRDAKQRRKILEKSRPEQGSGRGSSFQSMSGTGLGGGGMSQNGPRALLASGCRFADPALFLREAWS
jgi:hypothetical protein